MNINVLTYFVVGAHELIVYSLKQDRSWQISHDFFKPEPKDAELSVAGFKFEWQDGIFSTELSDCKTDGFRDLYFHALASTIMYRVPTRILRNETLATQGDLNQNGFEVSIVNSFLSVRENLLTIWLYLETIIFDIRTS